MPDAKGCVRFASEAVRSWTQLPAEEILGAGLQQLLPLLDSDLMALADMGQLPATHRSNVAVALSADDEPPRHLEVEIVNDPRDDGGKILFVYDVSPEYVLRRQLDEQSAFQNMLGKSKAMRQVFQMIEELARVDSTVLIEGAF